ARPGGVCGGGGRFVGRGGSGIWATANMEGAWAQKRGGGGTPAGGPEGPRRLGASLGLGLAVSAGAGLVLAGLLAPPQATAQTSATTVTFEYTGGPQTWTVPAGGSRARFCAVGAQGGRGGGRRGAGGLRGGGVECWRLWPSPPARRSNSTSAGPAAMPNAGVFLTRSRSPGQVASMVSAAAETATAGREHSPAVGAVVPRTFAWAASVWPSAC